MCNFIHLCITSWSPFETVKRRTFLRIQWCNRVWSLRWYSKVILWYSRLLLEECLQLRITTVRLVSFGTFVRSTMVSKTRGNFVIYIHIRIGKMCKLKLAAFYSLKRFKIYSVQRRGHHRRIQSKVRFPAPSAMRILKNMI